MVDEIDEGIEEESIITGVKPEKLDLNGIKKVHKLLVIAEAGIVDRLEMILKEKFSDFFISLSILYKYLAENLYFIDHKYLFLAVTPSHNKEKHLNHS